jgi:ribose transport system permease protein
MQVKRVRLSQNVLTAIVTVILFVAFAALLKGFLTSSNILDLIENVSVIGLLSLGMTVVVIGRGIDLSMVAALVVPTGLFLTLVTNGWSPWTAILPAAGLSLFVGLLNGWLVAFTEIPPLFATLATGLFLAGFGQARLFNLETIRWSHGLETLAWVGQGRIFGLPASVFILLCAAVAVAAALRWTQVGADIYAIGDNPLAARMSGIPTRPIIVSQYAVAALFATFAGIVLAASSTSLETRLYNSSLIYDVILVVVLGGVGLSGGRGGALSVLIGTLLIGTLLNGMTIMDLSYSDQNLVKGIILLSAIILDTAINPRNEQTTQQGDI